MNMDWKASKNLAAKMLETCTQELKAGHNWVTIMAALLILVAAFDSASREADMGARPSDMAQFYGWAARCLAAIARLFPEETEKPN